MGDRGSAIDTFDKDGASLDVRDRCEISDKFQ